MLEDCGCPGTSVGLQNFGAGHMSLSCGGRRHPFQTRNTGTMITSEEQIVEPRFPQHQGLVFVIPFGVAPLGERRDPVVGEDKVPFKIASKGRPKSQNARHPCRD